MLCPYPCHVPLGYCLGVGIGWWCQYICCTGIHRYLPLSRYAALPLCSLDMLRYCFANCVPIMRRHAVNLPPFTSATYLRHPTYCIHFEAFALFLFCDFLLCAWHDGTDRAWHDSTKRAWHDAPNVLGMMHQSCSAKQHQTCLA